MEALLQKKIARFFVQNGALTFALFAMVGCTADLSMISSNSTLSASLLDGTCNKLVGVSGAKTELKLLFAPNMLCPANSFALYNPKKNASIFVDIINEFNPDPIYDDFESTLNFRGVNYFYPAPGSGVFFSATYRYRNPDNDVTVPMNIWHHDGTEETLPDPKRMQNALFGTGKLETITDKGDLVVSPTVSWLSSNFVVTNDRTYGLQYNNLDTFGNVRSITLDESSGYPIPNPLGDEWSGELDGVWSMSYDENRYIYFSAVGSRLKRLDTADQSVLELYDDVDRVAEVTRGIYILFDIGGDFSLRFLDFDLPDSPPATALSLDFESPSHTLNVFHKSPTKTDLVIEAEGSGSKHYYHLDHDPDDPGKISKLISVPYSDNKILCTVSFTSGYAYLFFKVGSGVDISNCHSHGVETLEGDAAYDPDYAYSDEIWAFDFTTYSQQKILDTADPSSIIHYASPRLRVVRSVGDYVYFSAIRSSADQSSNFFELAYIHETSISRVRTETSAPHYNFDHLLKDSEIYANVLDDYGGAAQLKELNGALIYLGYYRRGDGRVATGLFEVVDGNRKLLGDISVGSDAQKFGTDMFYTTRVFLDAGRIQSIRDELFIIGECSYWWGPFSMTAIPDLRQCTGYKIVAKTIE